MSRTDLIQFGAMIHGVGGTTDGWRHPDADPTASTNAAFYRQKAQTAERGCSALLLLRTACSFLKSPSRIS